jgi:hypothetical protein
MIELAQNSYREKGEMLLSLESVLEEAVKEGVITKEASIYVQDTMEEISADHGCI